MTDKIKCHRPSLTIYHLKRLVLAPSTPLDLGVSTVGMPWIYPGSSLQLCIPDTQKTGEKIQLGSSAIWSAGKSVGGMVPQGMSECTSQRRSSKIMTWITYKPTKNIVVSSDAPDPVQKNPKPEIFLPPPRKTRACMKITDYLFCTFISFWSFSH